MFRIMILIGMTSLVVSCTASRGSQIMQTGTVPKRPVASVRYIATVNDLISRPDNRLIETEAEMYIMTNDRAATVDSLYSLVEQFDGYVQKSTLSGLGFRIPTDCLTEFMRACERLGEVTYRYVSTTDITESYLSAINIREKNEAARQRFLELMGQAVTVEEVVKVEHELERINEQIADLDQHKQESEYRQKYISMDVDVKMRPSTKPGPVGFMFYQIYKGGKWLFVRK